MFVAYSYPLSTHFIGIDYHWEQLNYFRDLLNSFIESDGDAKYIPIIFNGVNLINNNNDIINYTLLLLLADTEYLLVPKEKYLWILKDLFNITITPEEYNKALDTLNTWTTMEIYNNFEPDIVHKALMKYLEMNNICISDYFD
jgi:hypothetical protein